MAEEKTRKALMARARSAALTELARLHPQDFKRLYEYFRHLTFSKAGVPDDSGDGRK